MGLKELDEAYGTNYEQTMEDIDYLTKALAKIFNADRRTYGDPIDMHDVETTNE